MRQAEVSVQSFAHGAPGQVHQQWRGTSDAIAAAHGSDAATVVTVTVATVTPAVATVVAVAVLADDCPEQDVHAGLGASCQRPVAVVGRVAQVRDGRAHRSLGRAVPQ